MGTMKKIKKKAEKIKKKGEEKIEREVGKMVIKAGVGAIKGIFK